MITQKSARGMHGRLKVIDGKPVFCVRQTDGTYKNYLFSTKDIIIEITDSKHVLKEYSEEKQGYAGKLTVID